MAGFLRTLIDEYYTEIERHRNRPFMKATMAACALIAISDGEVTLSERIRVDQIVETLDALKVFDPHEAVDLFNDFTSAIRKSPKHGREQAIEAIQAVSENRETAALLVRVCLAISEARGPRSLVKQIEVVMLCGLLNIEPRDFGLYADGYPEDIMDRLPAGDTSDQSKTT